jgi:hypothetical protein
MKFDGVWQSIELITDTSTNLGNIMACIAIDSEDKPHVVWTDQGYGDNPNTNNIQYSKKTTSWQPPEGVTDEALLQGASEGPPSIAIDTDDNVHVVWRGLGWGTFPDKYSIQHRIRTSTGWGMQETVAEWDPDSTGEQVRWPILMWAMHPEVSGVRTNIPDSEYSLIFTGVNYYEPLGYSVHRIVYVHVDLAGEVEEQIEDLIETIESMELPLEQALINPLRRAIRLLDRPGLARSQINTFIRRCRIYLRFGQITQAEYDHLIDTAREIRSQI